MNEQEKNQYLELLNFLAEAESSIAELYEACSQVWKIDAPFWLEIVQEERKHTAAIKQIQNIISSSPEQFTSNEPFKPIALQTFIHMIKEILKKVNNGQLTRDNILSIARDIEQSVIETKYNRFVKTDNSEYNQLVEQIVTETHMHKDLFTQKLEEVKKK